MHSYAYYILWASLNSNTINFKQSKLMAVNLFWLGEMLNEFFILLYQQFINDIMYNIERGWSYSYI